jgi:hypothetical protein
MTTINTCPACTSAAQQLHHTFTASCRGCCARSIARSPQAAEARKLGQQTRAYRALLEQVGGTVKPPLVHADVTRAWANDKANAPVAA